MALLRDPRYWPAGRPTQQPFPVGHHQVLAAQYKLSSVAVPPRRSRRMGNSNSHQSVYLTQPPVMAAGFDPRMVDPRNDPRFRGDPRYGDVMDEEEFLHYRGRGERRDVNGPERREPPRKGDKKGLLGRKSGKSASPAASLERRLGMAPQNKVLPDGGVISPKEILRPTELGSILQKGGTITGRRRELLMQQEAAAKQKQPRSSSSPRMGQERLGSSQHLEVKESSLPRKLAGKYDRMKSKSTILYPQEGREDYYGGSAPRAPSRSRDRSASRGLDSRSIERLSTNGLPGPHHHQMRPQSSNAYHPDFEPRSSRIMEERPGHGKDGPTRKPRKQPKIPTASDGPRRPGYPAEDDINVDETYSEVPLPNGRKSAAGVIDVDYRHGMSGGRRSASEFLTSIWRRGARTPDPLMEKAIESKPERKRLFRPKSETRPGANPNWYPDTISSTGRQSAADIHGYRDGRSSTTPSQSKRERKREEKLSRNRAKSVDCLQHEIDEAEALGPAAKPSGIGNWMNAFSKSMTSLAPLQPNGAPPIDKPDRKKHHQRLFNPNDTIESCKSKTSSRSARSKASVKSENKRKSRRDAVQAVADECRSPSRIEAYSAAPKNASHWRSIDNIFSRSKSRSREVLNDEVDSNKKPSKIEFGIQVLPRQFQKKEDGPARSSSADKKVKDTPKDLEGAKKKQFYFGMETHKEEETKAKGSSERLNEKPRASSGQRKSSEAAKKKGRQLPEDEIERFASRLQSSVVRSESNDSYAEEVAGMAANSAVTSERAESAHLGRMNSTMSCSEDEGDIPVKIRPVLPRKHLDMPRFSPMAAWRGIVTNPDADEDPDYAKARNVAMAARQQGGRKSSLGNNSSQSSNEPELFEEQIIQESSRQSNRNHRQMARQRHEKSADSGISGDTGSPGPTMKRAPNQASTKSPPAVPDRPLAASSPVHHVSHRPMLHDANRSCWTPEQDLDDSMNDGSHHGHAPDEVNSRPELATPPKLIHRNTMFSTNTFSLPREKGQNKKPPSSQPKEGKSQSFSSLRKLKRSVSNALHQEDSKTRASDRLPVDENWSMSRSVPNTLDTRVRHPSHQVMESWSDIEETDYDVIKGEEVNVNKVTSIRTRGHIVYLPEYKSVNVSRPRVSNEDEDEYEDSVSRPHSAINESLEFAPPCRRRETSPGSEMPPGATNDDVKVRIKKGKKFTYQSTVRQIERKRLEQQLSKETEEKEKQRLREQEIVRKVEEEFRKKRNREKTSIQHQLNELRRSNEFLDQVPFHDEDKQVEDKGQTKTTKTSFFMAGKDTYAVPNKKASLASNTNGALVQVRPYTSHPISMGEKVGITSPPPPPMSPPPALTSDDYLPEPAPVVRSSVASDDRLQGPVPPSGGSGGFFKELKSRLGKSTSHKPLPPAEKPLTSDLCNKEQLKGQSSSSRSSGSLSPTRQDPEGAPASASASSIAGTSSHDKASPRSDLNEMDSSLLDSPVESMRRDIVTAARSRNGAVSPLSRSEESGSNRDDSVDLAPQPGRGNMRSNYQGKPTAAMDKQRSKIDEPRDSRTRPSIYRQLEELVERERRYEINAGSSKMTTDGGSSSFSSMSATGGTSSRPTTSSSSYYSRHQQHHGGKDLLMLVNSADDGDDSMTTSVDESSSCATPIVTAPPTLTKELSEFKEERRDYRDYVVPSNGSQNMWSPRMTPSPYGGISRISSSAAGDIYGTKSEASLRTRSPGTRTPNSRRVGTPMSTHTQSTEKSLGLPVVSDNYRRDFVRSPIVSSGPPPVPEKPVHYTHPEKVADLGKNPRVITQPPPSVPGAPFVFH